MDRLPGMDYRYGFPMSPAAIEALEALPEDRRDDALQQLRVATFEAEVQSDLDQLPVGD